jgi:predicted nucleic acid-binding protein
MFLIDTNVVSQRTKLKPNPAVVTWLLATNEADLRVSAITIQEIRLGIERLDAGRRRREIERWLEDDLLHRFAGRILPVDAVVADQCGRLIATANRQKHNPDLSDALIAATAVVHGLQIATLNHKHFEPLGSDLVEF